MSPSPAAPAGSADPAQRGSGHEVTLPRGLERGGAVARRATLRAATGADEEVLAEAAGELPAARVSRLLGRCLVALDGEPVDGAATARRLAVGDREALLLHLRRLTFGEVMDCLLACPACGERMDLEVAVADLLLAPAEAPATVETTVTGEGGPFAVRFHPPTGADQEAAAAALLAEGAAAAERRLVERIVEEVRGPDGAPRADLPPAVLDGLAAAVAAADPQSDLVLRLQCPECGEPFTSRFDTAAYLLDELAGGRERLYRQVHALAFHYHWSEADILALTPRKRRLYLELLADALGGGAAA
ncbi:MAG TPA: hypothetical protein VHQ65_15270 [Thermoanaerobaculia bacterium]|nr:hypothetical protein [Thermoanaerobaculia bacterium]